MIVLDVQQGSPEWIKARLGVITASAIGGVIQPKKLLPCASDAYLNRLAAEIVLGRPVDEVSSDIMDRGHELEADARRWFSFDADAGVTEVGFVTTDDGRVGCSPDGLVGDDEGLEIKSPMAVAHVGYVRDPASLVDAYVGQIQASLYVTGRKAWNIVSYNPVMKCVRVRVLPDAKFQAALADLITKFIARLDEAVELLRPPENPFL